MSSGSDLETTITQKIAEKRSKKSKKKSNPKPTTVVAAPSQRTSADGKNEGDDPNWAYAPPEGAERLDHAIDAGDFEWDAIKDDDDTEIWLIRVPDTIKAKHLDGLEIDAPSSSRTARIGGLTRKTASYDIWSVATAAGDDDEADDADPACAAAEELLGLSCLLSRKRKKGRLYVAPKRVARRIVVAAKPSTATAPEHQPVVHQNPPRPSYPKEVLKHAFVPYGARSTQTRSEDVVMDDVEISREKPISDVEPSPKEKPAKTKESKRKKRKGEGDSPKKSKKHKSET